MLLRVPSHATLEALGKRAIHILQTSRHIRDKSHGMHAWQLSCYPRTRSTIPRRSRAQPVFRGYSRGR